MSSQASSAGKMVAEVRRLIETGHVDITIAIRSNFSIPAGTLYYNLLNSCFGVFYVSFYVRFNTKH